MGQGSNRVQLYTCSKCKQVGHNSRTCGKLSLRPVKRSTPPRVTPQSVKSTTRRGWENRIEKIKGTAVPKGVVRVNTIAAWKREMNKPSRVLVCVDNPRSPVYIGVTLIPYVNRGNDIHCQLEPPVRNSNGRTSSVLSFAFPKASNTIYNPDGSITKKNAYDNSPAGTYIIFENGELAEAYLKTPSVVENLKNRKEEVEKEIEQARLAKKAQQDRLAKEAEKKFLAGKTEYDKNPRPCFTQGCDQPVPYDRSMYNQALCENCQDLKEREQKEKMRTRKDEEMRLVNTLRGVTFQERFTLIQKTTYGNTQILTNIRVKVIKNWRGERAMYLKPRARKRGFEIPTSSVLVNSEGEVVYSSKTMIDVCKNHLMAQYGYTDVEAETYATLISES